MPSLKLKGVKVKVHKGKGHRKVSPFLGNNYPATTLENQIPTKQRSRLHLHLVSFAHLPI